MDLDGHIIKIKEFKMRQYIKLLEEIQERGIHKPAARKNMPGTTSLFGYQFRHNLNNGFPLLTTKEVNFKNIVGELLWFLKGDSNIKYLVDNGINIWNEDAYQYYLKQFVGGDNDLEPMSLERFVELIKDNSPGEKSRIESETYKLGDTGYQYPTVWRRWKKVDLFKTWQIEDIVDQIQNVINGLINNPESRRHIVTAVDPAHDTELALYWCHSIFQFNARPLTSQQRQDLIDNGTYSAMDSNIPKYYLDCQLYQRSADVVLGVPYNIASYALLTHIIAALTGMVPGEFIHTFGDVHIYDNHMDAVETQILRDPTPLPKLGMHSGLTEGGLVDFKDFIENVSIEDFWVVGYEPQERIKAKLSTGLK